MKKTMRKMSVKEVSKYFSVSEKTVNRLIHSGILPGVKGKNGWYFHQNRLESWVKDQINNKRNRRNSK